LSVAAILIFFSAFWTHRGGDAEEAVATGSAKVRPERCWRRVMEDSLAVLLVLGDGDGGDGGAVGSAGLDEGCGAG